ncbi:MAG TPA: lamin tail domain-containing protein, partial [Candidatus Thermoplasmatota archaeon]|nr:lamin tail domain-containing protein [Candidatus Thermoplasmatota archaeon]
ARDDDAAPSAPRERRPHLRILATEECPNAGTEDHRASVAILRNDSNATIELHGFALASTEGHTFTFPPGRTIGPGQTVRVHTCEMPEGARDFVWRQLAWCGVLYPLVLKSHGATVDRLTPEGYDAARLKDCKQGFRATATSPPR